MSISIPSAVSSLLPNKPQSASLTAKPADAKSPEEKFLEYAKMTPAERMHAAILGQMGLTEDQFKAMDPAAQQEVEQKIQALIQQQAQNGGNKSPGLIADKSV